MRIAALCFITTVATVAFVRAVRPLTPTRPLTPKRNWDTAVQPTWLEIDMLYGFGLQDLDSLALAA